jgi:hypothetical protein
MFARWFSLLADALFFAEILLWAELAITPPLLSNPFQTD